MQNYIPPTVQKIPPSATTPRKKNSPSIAQKVFFGIIGIIAMMFFIPKILKNMGDSLAKQAGDNQKQIIQNMKNAQPESPNAQSSVAPLVLVKGKTLKECAPNNYINEAALRCTKDHYEPPQNGNH